MNTKYTAILNDQAPIQFRLIEQHNGETVSEMLKREGLADYDIFLFPGHPDPKILEALMVIYPAPWRS